MTTKRKILQKIVAGSKNIRFSDMLGLVEGQAKVYQMRQFLKLV